MYSPVLKMTTLRALLVLGNQNKCYFTQLDVKSAFQQGKLTDDVYIYPPEL